MSFQQHITLLTEHFKEQGHTVSFTIIGPALAHGYCTGCHAAFTVTMSDRSHRVMGISTSHPCIHQPNRDRRTFASEPAASPAH